MTAARGTVVGVSPEYESYSDVPFYRRQWFFWTMWVCFAPVAVGVRLTGNVYYVNNNAEVRAFGKFSRIYTGLLALVWSVGILVALINPNVFGRVQQEGAMKATRQTAPAAAESREIKEPQVQEWRQPPEGSLLTHGDDTQAVDGYRKAAEQGNADAQSNLGWAYANGRGVQQDDVQVVYWLRKAAEQGHVEAQFNLGWAYENGRGVPQDDVEAHKWMDLAAAHTSGADQKRFADERDAVAKKMTPDQLSEAQKRARAWMEAFEKRQK